MICPPGTREKCEADGENILPFLCKTPKYQKMLSDKAFRGEKECVIIRKSTGWCAGEETFYG